MFKKIYDTPNYEDKRPLPIEKNKKKVVLMKDEFGGKIMKEVVALGPKMYRYRAVDECVDEEICY